MAKKMLLVEDSITTQKAVTTAFEREDFDIITANHADQALHELQTLVPDIILADASMADLDGFRLCQVVRNSERTHHVPVLLLTSGFTAYDQSQGHEVGVNAHLSKPFEPQELRALVQQLVATASVDPAESVVAPTGWQAVPDTGEAPAAEFRAEPYEGRIVATPPTLAAPGSVPDSVIHQSLGSHLLHTIQESLHAQLGNWLDNLTPQIVEAVQNEVAARMPALLEALLQKEIDKLKQAVEHDAPQGDQ